MSWTKTHLHFFKYRIYQHGKNNFCNGHILWYRWTFGLSPSPTLLSSFLFPPPMYSALLPFPPTLFPSIYFSFLLPFNLFPIPPLQFLVVPRSSPLDGGVQLTILFFFFLFVGTTDVGTENGWIGLGVLNLANEGPIRRPAVSGLVSWDSVIANDDEHTWPYLYWFWKPPPSFFSTFTTKTQPDLSFTHTVFYQSALLLSDCQTGNKALDTLALSISSSEGMNYTHSFSSWWGWGNLFNTV